MAATIPRRVLIVDDNVALAENIAEILQLDGHLTEIAASAEEGLAKVLEQEPEVVVTDYRLPGMNGAVFVKQLRSVRAQVLAVVISAYTDQRTVEDAMEAGAAFIPKPVDFTALSRIVRQAAD